MLKDSSSGYLQMAAVIALAITRSTTQRLPDRLRGRAYPLEARIVAIADVYDGAHLVRPIKPGWPWRKLSSI